MLKFQNKVKVNIKFISGTIPFGDSIYINPAYWTLKSWYKRHGQNNHRINWLSCLHHNVGLNETTLTEIIEKDKPDIICFGLYIWNQDLYDRLGRFIKKKYPDIILIGGGPDVYAHKNSSLFWKNYNWLDFAVYGDGEEAFTLLIDKIISNNESELINVSYRDSDIVVQPFKRFKNKEFNLVSPFLDNVDDVKYSVDSIRALDLDLEIRINWEFTKGCPYACSFCDWSSGLHHKVTRKEYDWKLDLEFLSSLDVTVRWADANIGMFKNDIDIIKHAYSLEDANPKFQFIFRDFAKLHKKSMFDIIDYIETVRPGKIEHFLTVQDIDEGVLKNIDRPDVPWQEFKNYIVETKNKHKDFVHSMEVMIGLPGQTLELFAENLVELTQLKPKQVLGHLWCMLINSPGYQEEYRKKYDLTVFPVYNISKINDSLQTRDDILNNIDLCEYYLANVVLGTYTATMGDIIAMYSMVTLYNQLNNMRSFHLATFHKIALNIEFWRNFGNSIATILEKDLQIYKKILLLPELNFRPVTFSTFFGTKDNLLSFIKQAHTSANTIRAQH